MDLQKSILWRNNGGSIGVIKDMRVDKSWGILIGNNIHNIFVRRRLLLA